MIFDKYPWKEGKRLQIMDEHGKIVNTNEKIVLTDNDIWDIYRKMRLSRRLDLKLLEWYKAGKMPTSLHSAGQEATEMGYTSQIKKGHDWFVSAYRNTSAWVSLDIPIKNILMYWAGNEWGSHVPQGITMLPIQVCIGTQYSHAAGLAFAEKFYKKTDSVTFVTIGDGGTAEGEVYEAMNFAKLHKLPVVFMVENNGYALTTPTEKLQSSKTFAQRSSAFDIPSMQVDGNDLLATSLVAHEAKEYAKKHGPVFIEFMTYRMNPHSATDDVKAYRKEDLHVEKIKFDPLIRLTNYILEKKLATQEEIEQMDAKYNEILEQEFNWVQQHKEVKLEDIFKYTLHSMTPDLKHQLEEAKKELGK